MKTHKEIIILVLVSTIFLFFQLGGKTLYKCDEMIYAAVSQEIVNTGDWLTLHFNHERWLEKPPLFMWLTAGLYKVFGVSELTARLVSALSGVGMVMLVFVFALKMFNRRSAFISAMILLSTLGFLEFSKTGMMVSLVMFLFTLSLYFFYLGIKGDSSKFILSGIVFGIVLMTKGVVGLLIPVTQILYLIAIRDKKRIFDKMWILGIITGLIIALPWHVYQCIKYKNVFLDEYIGFHVISRIKDEGIVGYSQPWYYQFKSIFNKFRPWFIVLPFAILYFLKNVIENHKRDVIFVFVWMGFIFTVFSLPKVKYPHYIFPMFPAMAICVGHSIAEWTGKVEFKRIVIAGIIIMLLHIPFDKRMFSSGRYLDIKELSLEVKKQSNREDVLWISKEIFIVVPIFYSNRRTCIISDWREYINHCDNEKRIFMMITKEKYSKYRDEFTDNKYNKICLGNYILLYKEE